MGLARPSPKYPTIHPIRPVKMAYVIAGLAVQMDERASDATILALLLIGIMTEHNLIYNAPPRSYSPNKIGILSRTNTERRGDMK